MLELMNKFVVVLLFYILITFRRFSFFFFFFCIHGNFVHIVYNIIKCNQICGYYQ